MTHKSEVVNTVKISGQLVPMSQDSPVLIIRRAALVKAYAFYLVGSLTSSCLLLVFFLRIGGDSVSLSSPVVIWAVLFQWCMCMIFSFWLFRAFVGRVLRKCNLPEPTLLAYGNYWIQFQFTSMGNQIAAFYGLVLLLLLWTQNTAFRNLFWGGPCLPLIAVVLAFLLTQFAAFRRIIDRKICVAAPEKKQVGWNTLALNIPETAIEDDLQKQTPRG